MPPARTADALLKQALDGGAPDNVTVVLVDVGGQHPVFIGTPTIVGSASNPSGVVVPAARPSRSGWLHHARQVANEPTHFEPAAEFLEELIEEDRRRARRRRFGWLAALILVLAGIGVGLFAGYNWTQTLYYVGADSDSVVIYRGIQQSIGPISLSTVYQDTNIPLSELSDFDRQTVQATISAPSLNDAEKIVERLRPAAEGSG
jgi:protein phosphatase